MKEKNLQTRKQLEILTFIIFNNNNNNNNNNNKLNSPYIYICISERKMLVIKVISYQHANK